MAVAPISQPFDLSPTLRNNRATGVVFLTLAILLGAVVFLHFEGHFQLPVEYSTLPFDELCGGFAFLFFVFGIRSYFRRLAYRVDPSKQTIQRVTGGVFGTRYDEEIPFSLLKHVQVVREARGTHKSKHTYFPVYIHLKSDDQKQVFLSDRYPAARVCGETLAKLANVKLHDDSQPGATQVRQPGELDETVREKLRNEFTHQLRPSAPPRMRAKIQPGVEALTIENPRFDIASLGPTKKALWVLFAIFGGWAAVFLYFEEYIFALFGAVVVAAMLYALLRTETMTLTRDTLAVRAGIFFLKRTKRIPLSELEELCLLNATESESEDSDKLLEKGQIKRDIHKALGTIVALGSAIVARSDRESITFGRTLANAELDCILYEMESRIGK